MSDFELLSIGDASLDVFVAPSESEALCTVNEKDCLICFNFGDKIPVKALEFSNGGNAANNVVGVTKLGVKAGIVLTVGSDDIGNQIIEHLKRENIDTSFIIQEPNTRSNYSTVITYGGERTIFVYHAPRIYKFPENLAKSDWAYLTSMGESFQPFYTEVLKWLEANPETKLAFNPGSYQLRAGVDVLKPVLARTHVVFVNRQEAEKLTHAQDSTSGKEKQLLEDLSALGPKISVITDGGNGSFIYDGSRFVHAAVFPLDAYERTGAGDAFGSGCLAALIKGKSLEEALMWGTLNSASVISYTGPQKGLIKTDEMQTWLDRAKSSGVEVEQL